MKSFESLTLAALGLMLSVAAVAQPSGGFRQYKVPQTGELKCAQWQVAAEWQPVNPNVQYQDGACKVVQPAPPAVKNQPATPPGLAKPRPGATP